MIRGDRHLTFVDSTSLPNVEGGPKREQQDNDQTGAHCSAGIALSLVFKERLSNFGKLTIARRAVFDVRPNGIVKSDLPKSRCLKDRRIWAADPLRVRVSGSP